MRGVGNLECGMGKMEEERDGELEYDLVEAWRGRGEKEEEKCNADDFNIEVDENDERKQNCEKRCLYIA